MSDLASILEQLTRAFPTLSPQLQRAAKFIMDAPEDVAIKSMRTLAQEADVAPSTMVRLAKTLGFGGYDELRNFFQQAVRGRSFSSRAEWLHHVADEGAGHLVKNMARAGAENLETTYSRLLGDNCARAATLLREADRVYVLGNNAIYGVACYFYHLARMVMPHFHLCGGDGGASSDALYEVGPRDAVVAISFYPYSRRTVETLAFARERAARIVAVTDSLASPLAEEAHTVLRVATAGPLFFPSQATVLSVLETLVAVMVSEAGEQSVRQLTRVEEQRDSLGVYWFASTRTPPATDD